MLIGVGRTSGMFLAWFNFLSRVGWNLASIKQTVPKLVKILGNKEIPKGGRSIIMEYIIQKEILELKFNKEYKRKSVKN